MRVQPKPYPDWKQTEHVELGQERKKAGKDLRMDPCDLHEESWTELTTAPNVR